MIDLERVLNQVPDYPVFYTVEEMNERSFQLARKHPDVVEITEAGKSKEGRPIYCLKIGSGSQNALLYGTPHPNEPIGTMMLDALTEILATDKQLLEEMDYTWYIIKSCDVDGLTKNEGWLKGPFTITNYQHHFFRPAFDQQVEWSFPVDYKRYHFNRPTPETQCLMRLVDEIHPKFIYSLHNCGFGGVYWYISDGTQELFQRLHDVPAKYQIGLNLGEAEMPYCKNYFEAIYQMVGMKDNYDYMEQFMPDKLTETMMSGGACCIEYANRDGGDARIIVTEMPYYIDPRVFDMSVTDIPRAQAILESCDIALKDFRFWSPLFDRVASYMRPENQYYLAARERRSMENSLKAKQKLAQSLYQTERATVCQLFDNRYSTRFYANLNIVLVRRGCEEELARDDLSPEGRKILQEVRDQLYARECENLAALEEAVHYEAVPISKLVKVQMECGLIYAEYVHRLNEQ